MRHLLLLLAVLSLLSCTTKPQKAISLDKVEAQLSKAEPGDTIFVSPGTYNDLTLRWQGRGEQQEPIVVKAIEPEATIITGTTSLQIYGRYLEVQGLHFLKGTPTKSKSALIEFRCGDSLAQYCRLTDCVIDSYNASRRDLPSSYIHLYGRHNRIDHNSFIGKKSLGVTLIVMLNYPDCDENQHLIEDNYFGPRPVYGSNGAETIRVGTSQQCMQSSRSIIRRNLFYRCNGEVEVVSIKSCDNLVSDNIFLESQGVLALRHGDRNQAISNLFIGNHIHNTGGIRIVGEDQIVRANRFFSLNGARFFSALALMNAVPNSLPNRYMQVKGCDISDNTFVDCTSIEFGTGADFERTLPPASNSFHSNLIINSNIKALAPLKDNKFYNNKTLNSTRIWRGFELYEGEIPQTPAIDFERVGAGWHKKEEKLPAQQERQIVVGADEELAAIVSQAESGTTIVLSDSLYLLEKGLKVATKLSLVAQSGLAPTIRFVGKKADNMITLCDGADLRLEGLCFDGSLTSGRSLAKAAICTAAEMLEPYRLALKGCTFINFGESGFFPVKAGAGSFAERVDIDSCHFEALSGDAINYAAELDDKGRYNVDSLSISSCSFERILGLPINVYRGGSDESTAGPYVFVNDCIFTDCCNKVRGSAMRIIGAQILQIRGCSFVDSARGGYSIRLDDAPWEQLDIADNSFLRSGGILSNRRVL